MTTASQPETSFEAAFRELTEIVGELETGELTLDQTIALYERGRDLVRRCEGQLDTAELRVSQLTADADGTLRAEPLR
jgi:exodeoxyribonuclease VII small subunit